jgi:hypothetical protein
MAITTDQIRNLLGRPKGLLADTINEYINMRTDEVDKVARTDLYLVDSTYAVTAAQKENAIKYLVCVDCLVVLIDTLPSAFNKADDARFYDRRFQYQIDVFKKRADDALALISEKAGRAFAVKSTSSRIEQQ